MHISINNLATTLNTSVTGSANPDYSVADLISNDFSDQYTSTSSTGNFEITISEPDGIDYIAIAGSDYFGKVDGITFVGGSGESFNLIDSNGDNLLDANGDNLVVPDETDVTYAPDDNATIVHIFDDRITSAKVIFERGGLTTPITLSYFAAGWAWEVPNDGEMAGYRRPWSTPQLRNRTQVNKGMPTQAIVETALISGNLAIANMLTSDVKAIWAPFQSFAIREGFFIVEDKEEGDYGYYCFNAKTKAVSAHSSTRSLQNASIGFDCWTGRG